MPTPLNPAIVDLKRQQRPAYTDYRIRVTGSLNSDGTVSADPTSGLAVGYMWVHNEDGRANARVIIAPAFEAFSRTANLRVMTALNSAGERVALELVADSINAALSAQIAQASALGMVTPSQNIQGGRVQISPLGGMYVWVEALPEAGWTGGNLLIATVDVPTGAATAGWAVVYLDNATALPTYTLTTPESSIALDGTDISQTTAWNAPIPANAYRLGAFSLSYGQVAISYATSTFIDQRRWLVIESGADFDLIVTDADYTVVVDANGNVVVGA